MMHSNVDDNVHRTKIVSISNFKSFVQVTGAIAMMAISYPSQASQEQNAQAFANAAISLAAGDMARLHETEKRVPVKNTNPVAIADVMELKRSSNAFNVLANDSDPDGDRLILTDALAQFGAVAFTQEGLIGYAQNPGPPRADTITYTISDNKGNFARGTVEITVQ